MNDAANAAPGRMPFPERGLPASCAVLLGASITAAAAVVIARGLQIGGDPEKQIAERAYKIYQAVVAKLDAAAPAGPVGERGESPRPKCLD